MDVLSSDGLLRYLCLGRGHFQSSSAIHVLTFVMLVLRDVNGTMLITASNAAKYVVAVLNLSLLYDACYYIEVRINIFFYYF